MPGGNFTGPSWTEEQIAEAAELRKMGLSAGKIAERLGRTRNAIIGIMTRNRALFPKGKPGTPVRREPKEKPAPAPSGREWTGAEIGTAALMWGKGATVAEIAAKIGRPASRVYYYVAQHPKQFPVRLKIKSFEPGPLLSRKMEAPPAAPECQPVTLFDRRANQCHFPLWENYGPKPTADSLYCGGAAQGESDYCAFHHQLMYRPKVVVVKPEKRRAA